MVDIVYKVAHSKKYLLIVMSLILLFSAMRIVFINADPPSNLSYSAAIYTDEGFKTYTQRNMSLFDNRKWTPEDGYRSWDEQSPFEIWIYEKVFDRWGVSFVTVRAVSIFFGILTLLLLSIYVYRQYGRTTALVTLLLYGGNYMATMYSRLGLYETHLIFFIVLAMFGFTEFFRTYMDCDIKNRWNPFTYSLKTLLRLIISGAIGITGIIMAFYVKRSFFVIFAAVIPAILLFFAHHLKHEQKDLRRVFLFLFFAVLLFYVFMGHSQYLHSYVNTLLSKEIFGMRLGLLFPLKSFNPIHKAFIQSLYLEFIALQPVTFLLGIIYSLYTFHRLIYRNELSLLDLFMASWLLFGFLILTLMNYHPARYYLLLNPPLIILLARALTNKSNMQVGTFLTPRKPFPFNIFKKIFWFLAAFHILPAIILLIVPAEIRFAIIERFFNAFTEGSPVDVIHFIIVFTLIQFAMVFAIFTNRPLLSKWISHHRFHIIFIIIIISIQFVHYGKWAIHHKHIMYDTSRELARTLPPDTVLAGNWASQLALETNLRSLVIQKNNRYNQDVVEKILKNEPVEVNIGGKTTHETDIPLVYMVSTTAAYEKGQIESLKEYLTDENLLRYIRLGFFKIYIYRIH